jgi:hypothetical protein
MSTLDGSSAETSLNGLALRVNSTDDISNFNLKVNFEL